MKLIRRDSQKNLLAGVESFVVRRVRIDDQQGLAVRLKLRRPTATAEIDLGDDARFWPCDEALARWRSVAEGAAATIVYE